MTTLTDRQILIKELKEINELYSEDTTMKQLLLAERLLTYIGDKSVDRAYHSR